jgi:hypothetical protein
MKGDGAAAPVPPVSGIRGPGWAKTVHHASRAPGRIRRVTGGAPGLTLNRACVPCACMQ